MSHDQRELVLMPMHGKALWTACTSTVAQGLAIVRGWQTEDKLHAMPKAELRSLMGSPEMGAEQDKGIDKKADRALSMATAWAKDRDNRTADKRLFCWFFDLATQNGFLEGQTPST